MKRINRKHIPLQLTESTLKHVCGGGIATSPGGDATLVSVNKARTQDRMYPTYDHY